ncbi:DNA topoisomerase IB [Nocardia farcinica]|uniref:DNA topoisomerase IB n=1 Tax=Nocardia farcinica TaxID=37329 RepID=UPI0022BA0740|nr:DNA topoisomerase IB [Nocardia farcinica]MCZ9325306.1 DNA topoisomerase IB [Nocardia farcinica]
MRLRRSRPDGPGFLRVRRGRGFSYVTSDGETVTDEETLARIKALVIPPAWRDVWICPYPNGHLQAVGVDAAGRKQYLYHEQWRRERDEVKFDRVLEMAARLPEFRAQIAADLEPPGLERRRVEAVALGLIDRGVFRVGGEEYAQENGTRGMATLLRAQVTVSGAEMTFDYIAKSGIRRRVRIEDPALARAVRALKRSRAESARLLTYRCPDGAYRELHAEEINARFKELVGEECSAKDLRTWQGTVLAAVGFGAIAPPTSQRARNKAIRAVMVDVSNALGNTPAIAKSSYVDPRVVAAFEEGATIAAAMRRADRVTDLTEQQQIIDRAVIRLITAQQKRARRAARAVRAGVARQARAAA